MDQNRRSGGGIGLLLKKENGMKGNGSKGRAN